MSASWTDGYFTDSTYTLGYYKEMSPALLRFCLLLKQIAPPPTEGFRYCELAMGQGVSANIHAAANSGSFVGTDFNPDHAAFAARVSQNTGNGLEVFDCSFEEFLQREHSPYDYICLHGTWTWVSAANRALIVDFVGRHLKPGGAFYLSYNCFPGWAAAAPLRNLFSLFDTHYRKGRSAGSRVTSALEYMAEFLSKNPLYLNSAQGLLEQFESIKDKAPEYLAHEYLNADWDIMYFTDVARKLGEAKLRFGASAIPGYNISGNSLTEEAQQYLAGVEDPVVYQQLLDFFINCRFRKDIFIKGGAPITNLQQKTELLEQRFVLTRLPADIEPEIAYGMGSIHLDETYFADLLQVLAEDACSPKTLRHICAELRDKTDYSHVALTLVHLVTADHVAVCLPEEAEGQNRERCNRFNTEVFAMNYNAAGFQYIASPRTGGAAYLGRIDMLFLDALYRGTPAAQYVMTYFNDTGECLMHEGQPIPDPEQALPYVETLYSEFREKQLPLLTGLGLVP